MKPPATRRLGRGLSALIPVDEPTESPPAAAEASTSATAGLTQLPRDRILTGPQPRTQFDDTALEELADSIRLNGILQPILVRRASEPPGHYLIIAGERRFRAAGLAGLVEVPVLIREATEAEAYELALVENIQRADLDPIEEAQAYHHLAETYRLTQEQIARRVGKSRVTITNALRLLRLPAAVQALMVTGELSAGHARAILQAPEAQQALLAQDVVERGWSVRETERTARSLGEAPAAPPPPPAEVPPEPTAPAERSPDDEALEAQLRAALGAPVSYRRRGAAGRIEIRFHSRAELDRLLELLLSLEGR